jgi:hypothetical protein
MKRFLPLFTIFLFSVFGSLAQAPKGINYQGVARDFAGVPYASKSIGLRISILKNDATGEVEYSETHKLQTNQFGLFTLVIGQGTKVTGDFAFISWAVGNKWLQIEIDPNGGTSYALAGSQQLMTVPYAFYAEYAGNGGSGGTLTAGPGISITGNVISNTGDADNSTSNELQNLSDVLTQSNNAGGIKITNLGAPAAGTDAATKSYVDAQNGAQNLTTILTTGNSAGTLQIKNLGAPTDPNDAATKNYVDAQNALDLDKDPTNELQNLSQVLSRGTDAGGNRIQNVAAPTANTDVTNKLYVDNAIATNYAFKINFSYTNATGSLQIDQEVVFIAEEFDSFNVVGGNTFTASVDGIYVFTVEGTYVKAGIINSGLISLLYNSTRYTIPMFIPFGSNTPRYNATFMFKLTAGQTIKILGEIIESGATFSGNFFGYKL